MATGEAARLRTAGSNVFLGGTPASERFDTSYATTYVDTKDMLVDESKTTSALREGECEGCALSLKWCPVGGVAASWARHPFAAEHAGCVQCCPVAALTRLLLWDVAPHHACCCATLLPTTPACVACAHGTQTCGNRVRCSTLS